MRVVLGLLALVAGCASEPTIACNTDEQCVTGQRCSAGICRIGSTDSLSDANGEGDDGGGDDGSTSDAPMSDAPAPTCAPSCTGSTPYCVEATCVECRTSLDCPLLSTCTNHACS